MWNHSSLGPCEISRPIRIKPKKDLKSYGSAARFNVAEGP